MPKDTFSKPMSEVDYAHVVMLAEQGIITRDELKRLLKSLRSLDLNAIRAAEYDGSFEDLFYYLQREITRNCDPDTAGRLHTGAQPQRYRRDDLSACICARRPCGLLRAAMDLREVFLDLAAVHHETLIPAYTHTQPAQPLDARAPPAGHGRECWPRRPAACNERMTI
jgi:argininosuccinate lyase